ncbi:Tim10/DDP family zinc finger protein [Xylaria sp. CBS 124048]|nr:Tim10/DDP family zinc finger protein [Xylaria sp. CBS 124048]
MDSLQTADIEKLNDKDKAELRQFLQLEAQKDQIHSTVHALTSTCFNKCITGTIKTDKLDSKDEDCLRNCAQRFFDITVLTSRHLQESRRG